MGATGGIRNAVSPECEKKQIIELKRICELVVRGTHWLKKTQLWMVRLLVESWMTPSQVRLQLKFCSISTYITIKMIYFFLSMRLRRDYSIFSFLFSEPQRASHWWSLLIVPYRWNVELDFSLLWLNRAERMPDILATGWLFSRISGMARVSAYVSREHVSWVQQVVFCLSETNFLLCLFLSLSSSPCMLTVRELVTAVSIQKPLKYSRYKHGVEKCKDYIHQTDS